MLEFFLEGVPDVVERHLDSKKVLEMCISSVNANTVDREIFAELYFHVLNFSVLNFHHLAYILHCCYSTKEFFAHLIFTTQATGEKFFNGESFPIYSSDIWTIWRQLGRGIMHALMYQ